MAKTIGSFDLASLKYLRDDVTQYFWFESNSSSAWGSGAHVTLYPESQFTNPNHANYLKGQNIIMNTDGFSIRNGGLPMMVLDNDSLDFNAVDTSLGTYTKMATFGLSGMQIYSRDSNNNLVQLANIGYGPGIDSGGGTSDAPYYTLGIRDGTVGNLSVAEGDTTTASGYASHSEGENTTASGASSHAEGYVTTASKTGAHAEGMITTASGIASHAEGVSTKATGDNSHAQNRGTIASSTNQTALGRFNISDSADTYAVIIGNGTADNARSNALTVDWSGNVADGNGNTFIKCASGTDNGWSYRKYPDGTYDAWQAKPLNVARTTAYGQLYRCVEQTINMPSFNSGTDYIISGSVGGGDWLDTNIMYATSFTYYMVRTSSQSAQARTVRFYVHGTWS